MSRIDVDLLCLGNLLQQFLNDYSVVITYFAIDVQQFSI